MTKILLVDDVQLILGLERSFLKRTGCEVLTAQSGEEALLKVRTHQPDLVVLDVNMPGFDGLACCRVLKTDPTYKNLPVVLVSSAIDHERCLAAGGDGFVAKPVAGARLLDAVRRFVPIAERAGGRLAVGLKVEYSHQGEDGLGFTKDLSADGLFLKTRDGFEPGDTVGLAFTLPMPGGHPIHADAQVVRTEEARVEAHRSTGIGVAFRRLSARDRLEIARFVRERSAGTN
jgi:uncharacterized protein (TIGR02266 family)